MCKVVFDKKIVSKFPTLSRYILSGDLVAGRVTRSFNTDNTTTITKSWYHLDHLNSTKVVTNESGMIEVNYTYRAFGEQLKRMYAVGSETEDKAKYSYGGKELDDITNLYYFNARYYDATTGRFINVDAIQDGTNWYVYCSNNPLSMVDPTGLEDRRVFDITKNLLPVQKACFNLFQPKTRTFSTQDGKVPSYSPYYSDSKLLNSSVSKFNGIVATQAIPIIGGAAVKKVEGEITISLINVDTASQKYKNVKGIKDTFVEYMQINVTLSTSSVKCGLLMVEVCTM